jgi:hypothetical protein
VTKGNVYPIFLILLLNSGCAAVPLPIQIVSNGLDQYGYAIGANELEFAALKKDFEINVCPVWQRHFNALLAYESEKHPYRTLAAQINSVCINHASACNPPESKELEDLIRAWQMPEVVCP